MASRLVTIHFGGEWNMKEDGLSFLGDIVTKAFVITDGMTFNQLKEKVYSRFLVDDSVNRVKFTHLHPFENIKEPFLVESDGDLLEYMEISALVGVGWSLPLCVCVEKKIIDDKEIEDSQESLSALNIADDDYFKGADVVECEGNFATVDTVIECERNVDSICSDDAVVEDGMTQNSSELVLGGAADAVDQVENYQREDIRVDTSADTASDRIDQPRRFMQVDDDDEEDQSENEGDIVEYGKDAIMYDERHDKHFNGSIYVGKMFDSKEELREAIMMLAASETFGFRVKKSDLLYLRAVCIDHRHCKWKVFSSNVRGTSSFIVTSYNEKHTCSLEKRVLGCRGSSSKIIAKKIASRYEDIDDGPSPKSIINLMRGDHFTSVTYWKAFEARRLARDMANGTAEEGYALLPSYCYVLEQKNPGTVTTIARDRNDRFKYVFIAFGASIRGFNVMRKVIIVDATFLTGKYGGSLLIATAQDANHQIYPLAFAVVDSENNASWKWFFEQLVLQIPSSDELLFVSDRHRSIANGIQKVYTTSEHCLCTWHLKNNLRTRYRKSTLWELFTLASESYTRAEFRKHFDCIEKVNSNMSDYLSEKVGIYKWARSYSKRQRYNMMTSNNAETMNSVLRGTKSFPIVAFLKHIREVLSKWFNERRNKAENTILRLPDKINEIIEQRCEHVGRYNVKDLNTYQFEVVGDHTRVLVDMTAKSCSCNVFDLDHIPCVHAMAVILQKRFSTVNYVSPCYTNPFWCLAYRETIYPELTEKDWEVPQSIINEKCHPPIVRRKSGRPVKKRKMSAFEKNRRKRQCKSCGKKGHTAPSC